MYIVDTVIAAQSIMIDFQAPCAEDFKMIITPTGPSFPFFLPGTTMSIAFDPLPFPPLPPFPPPGWAWMRSLAPKITQPNGPNYFQLDYLLPSSTRVGDVLEFYLVDLSISFPVLIAKFVLDDYSVFLALRRYAGIFSRGERPVQDLIKLGINPGIYDLECVHYGLPTPIPPLPAPPGAQTPLRTVAVSFVNSYLIT